jgi:hypothetical protein
LSESEIKDLGFGAVVARREPAAALEPDGSFNVSRDGLPAGASAVALPRAAHDVRGRGFLFTVLAYYVAVNAAFA